jgi:hypothetical protein
MTLEALVSFNARLQGSHELGSGVPVPALSVFSPFLPSTRDIELRGNATGRCFGDINVGSSHQSKTRHSDVCNGLLARNITIFSVGLFLGTPSAFLATRISRTMLHNLHQ